MGVISNKTGRDELKAGDHIYSWRLGYLYSHHGIYIGDEKVVHFTRGAGHEFGIGTALDRIILTSTSLQSPDNPCPKCGYQSSFNGVISSCIDCFLWGGDLYRFEYSVSPAVFLSKPWGGTCTLAASDPPQDVLHRVSFLLKNGFGVYQFFSNNCEDFAIYCKTGLLIDTSMIACRNGQTTSLLAATSFTIFSLLQFITISFSSLAVAGYGMYCISRLVFDIGVRRDVVKIPVESLVACSGLHLAEVLADMDQEN